MCIDLEIPGGLDASGRRARVAPAHRACGRRRALPCSTSTRPLPSRSRRQLDLSLAGRALDLCGATHRYPSLLSRVAPLARISDARLAERTSRIASRKRSFSSSVPTVTRRQSSSPGAREKSLMRTEWLCSRSRQSARGVLDTEHHEVRLGREDLDAVHGRQPVHQRVSIAHDVADTLLEHHSLAEHLARRPTARTR